MHNQSVCESNMDECESVMSSLTRTPTEGSAIMEDEKEGNENDLELRLNITTGQNAPHKTVTISKNIIVLSVSETQNIPCENLTVNIVGGKYKNDYEIELINTIPFNTSTGDNKRTAGRKKGGKGSLSSKDGIVTSGSYVNYKILKEYKYRLERAKKETERKKYATSSDDDDYEYDGDESANTSSGDNSSNDDDILPPPKKKQKVQSGGKKRGKKMKMKEKQQRHQEKKSKKTIYVIKFDKNTTIFDYLSDTYVMKTPFLNNVNINEASYNENEPQFLRPKSNISFVWKEQLRILKLFSGMIEEDKNGEPKYVTQYEIDEAARNGAYHYYEDRISTAPFNLLGKGYARFEELKKKEKTKFMEQQSSLMENEDGPKKRRFGRFKTKPLIFDDPLEDSTAMNMHFFTQLLDFMVDEEINPADKFNTSFTMFCMLIDELERRFLKSMLELRSEIMRSRYDMELLKNVKLTDKNISDEKLLKAIKAKIGRDYLTKYGNKEITEPYYVMNKILRSIVKENANKFDESERQKILVDEFFIYDITQKFFWLATAVEKGDCKSEKSKHLDKIPVFPESMLMKYEDDNCDDDDDDDNKLIDNMLRRSWEGMWTHILKNTQTKTARNFFMSMTPPNLTLYELASGIRDCVFNAFKAEIMIDILRKMKKGKLGEKKELIQIIFNSPSTLTSFLYAWQTDLEKKYHNSKFFVSSEANLHNPYEPLLRGSYKKPGISNIIGEVVSPNICNKWLKDKWQPIIDASCNPSKQYRFANDTYETSSAVSSDDELCRLLIGKSTNDNDVQSDNNNNNDSADVQTEKKKKKKIGSKKFTNMRRTKFDIYDVDRLAVYKYHDLKKSVNKQYDSARIDEIKSQLCEFRFMSRPLATPYLKANLDTILSTKYHIFQEKYVAPPKQKKNKRKSDDNESDISDQQQRPESENYLKIYESVTKMGLQKGILHKSDSYHNVIDFVSEITDMRACLMLLCPPLPVVQTHLYMRYEYEIEQKNKKKNMDRGDNIDKGDKDDNELDEIK